MNSGGEQNAPAQRGVEAAAESKPRSIYDIITEAGKLMVFVVFILYALGFIIWHSFLGKYGISTGYPFQADYLSAAVCYLTPFLVVALPPALLLEAILSKRDKFLKHFHIARIVFVWGMASIYVHVMYFPEDLMSGAGLRFIIIVAACVLHITFILLCPSRWRMTKAYILVDNPTFLYLYFSLFMMVLCFWRPNVSGMFLMNTMMFYVIAFNIVGADIRWRAAELTLPVKFLFCIVIALLVVVNAHSFGTLQFGLIPRTIGGGKQELAYIKFGQQHSELASQLGIITINVTQAPNGFAGPIGILMRSERDIVFVIPGEDSDVKNSTRVTNFATNVTTQIMTNAVSMLRVTNVDTNIFTNVVTNLQPILNNRKAIKLGAKQVRADLIDAIEFVK